MNSTIWPIDGTLTGTTTLGQSGHESNGNEGVHHIPQTSRLELHHQMQFNVILKTLNQLYYTLAEILKCWIVGGYNDNDSGSECKVKWNNIFLFVFLIIWFAIMRREEGCFF